MYCLKGNPTLVSQESTLRLCACLVHEHSGFLFVINIVFPFYHFTYLNIRRQLLNYFLIVDIDFECEWNF